MNKKIILILASILVIVGGGVLYFLYKQPPRVNVQNNTTYPQTSNFDFYSIHEIKQNKFTSGNYNTEGYVVKIYTCPPCPKGAQCKPCMGDNIVISENNKLLETYTLSDNEMILFVNNPKQFELGEKYKFSVKILDYKSTSEPINDVEVVGYASFTQTSTSQTSVSSNTKNLCKTDKEFIDSVRSSSECAGQDFRCVDGWSAKVYYDKRLTTIIPKDESSLSVPEELKDAIIAKYGKSSCSCKTPISYQILSNGQLKETDCEIFYNFIENYDPSCNNCILTWETGCC